MTDFFIMVISKNMITGNWLKRILFDKYNVLYILYLLLIKAPFILHKLRLPNPLPPKNKDY